MAAKKPRKTKTKAAAKAKQARADKRAASAARREERKNKAKERKRIADIRKDVRLTKRSVRTGERKIRDTYKSGRGSCRAKRARADAPHKDALARNKRDFGDCNRDVERLLSTFLPDLAADERRLARMEAELPAAIPNARARLRQEQWGERIESTLNEISATHPELNAFAASYLAPMAAYGSDAARRTRSQIDRLIQGRPAKSLAERILEDAERQGFSGAPGSKLPPELQPDAGAMSRDVASMMRREPAPRPVMTGLRMGRGSFRDTGRPIQVPFSVGLEPNGSLHLARGLPPSTRRADSSVLAQLLGPSSAAEPSRVSPSRLAFDPAMFGAPRSGSVVESILGPGSVAPSTRAAPRTQASPGSAPRGEAIKGTFSGPKSSRRGLPSSKAASSRRGAASKRAAPAKKSAGKVARKPKIETMRRQTERLKEKIDLLRASGAAFKREKGGGLTATAAFTRMKEKLEAMRAEISKMEAAS